MENVGLVEESCYPPVRTGSDGHGPVSPATPQSAVSALENVVVLRLKQLHFPPFSFRRPVKWRLAAVSPASSGRTSYGG